MSDHIARDPKLPQTLPAMPQAVIRPIRPEISWTEAIGGCVSSIVQPTPNPPLGRRLL